MIKLYLFQHLSELRKETTSSIGHHKTLIIVSFICLISLIGLGVLATKLRNQLLSQIPTHQTASEDIFEASRSAVPTILLNTSTISSVLGTSGDSGVGDDSVDTSVPTYAPLPTPTPWPTPTPYSLPAPTTCDGTPTIDNSQAIVSTSSTIVGSSATITIELLDCNNNYAPVNDTLTITLASGDSSTKINGLASPVTVQAQNGKTTFTITSQNATTDTFAISDTTRSFAVTAPGYHNPAITFSNNTSGNSNCTTAGGVPNSWYSDVYPAGQQTVNAGSTVSYSVIIRDCNKNTVAQSDTLTITLTSGDVSTQVNGNNLPYSLTAQNGQATLTVLSEIAQTVTLTVTDTTSGFTVTDTNNNNPSVIFSGSSTVTPTPTPLGTDTPTPTPENTTTPTPTPPVTPTPLSNPTNTPTLSPTP